MNIEKITTEYYTKKKKNGKWNLTIFSHIITFPPDNTICSFTHLLTSISRNDCIDYLILNNKTKGIKEIL